ncbi:MAG: hypothetical protein JWM16_6311 [Verrucomicrobiales bacterium]|nr:hypothetical protein [Verrucomicrobiales bacterium]
MLHHPSHRLDAVEYRHAQIERFFGDTISVRHITEDDGPGYWHAFANEDNSFRPGSHTVASVTAESKMDVLDRIAKALGMPDEILSQNDVSDKLEAAE